MSSSNYLNLNYFYKISILAILYFLLGKLSFQIMVQNNIVSVVMFLPEGVALASVLIYGKKMWPGIFIGQFFLALSSHLPLGASLSIAAINSIEAIIGYILFYHNDYKISLETSRDVNGLIVIIFFVLQPFSAFFGNLALVLFGVASEKQFLINFLSWWFGNVMGQLQLTPLILYYYHYRYEITLKETLKVVLSVATLTFILQTYLTEINLSLILSITIPVVIYITIHKNLFYALLATLVISLVSLYSTRMENTIFWIGGDNSFYNLIDLNFYILTHILLVLFVGTMFKEKEKAIKQLEQLAHFDVLTGLPNRHLLKKKINKAILSANKHKTLSAICFIDMDGFKLVNDTYGHDAGDEVLKVVSSRISNMISDKDYLIRLGGDEFVLIINDISNLSEFEDLLKRIMQQASSAVIYKEHKLYVTLSIGIALTPTDSNNADTLLSYADIAMYEAKRRGKNKFVYYKDVQ